MDFKWDMRDDYFDTVHSIGSIRLASPLPDGAEDGVYDIVLNGSTVAQLALPTGIITLVDANIPAPPTDNDAMFTCPAFPTIAFALTTAERLVEIPKDGSRARGRYHHGVIAQEVQQVLNDLGTDFGGFQWHAHNGGDDVYSIGYDEFVGPLIKSVQELSAQLEDVRAELAALKALNK